MPKEDVPRTLETARLVFTAPRLDEAQILNACVVESMPELRAWQPWAKDGQTLEQTREFLTRISERIEQGAEYHWNLWLKSAGGPGVAQAFAGCCGMPMVNWDVPKLEIGYWLRTSCVGKGYMTEAVCGLTGILFEKLGAQRVEIITSDANVRSWRVAERAGFELEAVLRRHARENDGSLGDTRIYVRLRNGW